MDETGEGEKYLTIKDSAEDEADRKRQEALEYDPNTEGEKIAAKEINEKSLFEEIDKRIKPKFFAIAGKTLQKLRSGEIRKKGFFSKTDYAADWGFNHPPYVSRSSVNFRHPSTDPQNEDIVLKDYHLTVVNRGEIDSDVGSGYDHNRRLELDWELAKGENILALDLTGLYDKQTKDPQACKEKIVEWLGDTELTRFIGEFEEKWSRNEQTQARYAPRIKINLATPAIEIREGFASIDIWQFKPEGNPNEDSFKGYLGTAREMNFGNNRFLKILDDVLSLIPTE